MQISLPSIKVTAVLMFAVQLFTVQPRGYWARTFARSDVYSAAHHAAKSNRHLFSPFFLLPQMAFSSNWTHWVAQFFMPLIDCLILFNYFAITWSSEILFFICIMLSEDTKVFSTNTKIIWRLPYRKTASYLRQETLFMLNNKYAFYFVRRAIENPHRSASVI